MDRLDFEILFYERLLQKKPDFHQAIAALGEAYTRKGLYEKGLDVDLRLVKLRPLDEYAYYNCACDYSLLKQAEPSLQNLEKALVLGYRDYRFMEKDQDLAFVRSDPRYGVLIDKYRKRRLRARPSGKININ